MSAVALSHHTSTPKPSNRPARQGGAASLRKYANTTQEPKCPWGFVHPAEYLETV